MQHLPKTTLPGNEKGATLIVALIMLVLISLIGATSMRGATITEKMSANDYQKNITFQASESAATVTLADNNLLSQALIANAPVTSLDVAINVPNATADVVFTPVGASPVFGSSIGSDGFSGRRIMVTSTSQLTANNAAQTTTVHGVVRLVPGGGG